jgi:hypothetical protein
VAQARGGLHRAAAQRFAIASGTEIEDSDDAAHVLLLRGLLREKQKTRRPALSPGGPSGRDRFRCRERA